MKHKILILFSCFIFLFGGCENKSESPSSLSASQELLEIQEKAIERVASSKEIQSGELYEYVISICPSAGITDFGDGSISIRLSVEESSIESDTSIMFNMAEEICNNCHLEDDYASVGFMMRNDSTFIGILNLLNYESPDSFTSSFLITDSEDEDVIKVIYKFSSFYSNDIDNLRDAMFEDIMKNYCAN